MAVVPTKPLLTTAARRKEHQDADSGRPEAFMNVISFLNCRSIHFKPHVFFICVMRDVSMKHLHSAYPNIAQTFSSPAAIPVLRWPYSSIM
jgi:hypothetical protein